MEGIKACKKCGVYLTEMPDKRGLAGHAVKKCGIPLSGAWIRATYTDNLDWWRPSLEDSRDLAESEAGVRRAAVLRPIAGTEETFTAGGELSIAEVRGRSSADGVRTANTSTTREGERGETASGASAGSGGR